LPDGQTKPGRLEDLEDTEDIEDMEDIEDRRQQTLSFEFGSTAKAFWGFWGSGGGASLTSH
jgi:hypothetical protein